MEIKKSNRKASLESLFPTPIVLVDLDVDVKAMAKECLSLSKKSPSVKKSNSGGWQSDDVRHLSSKAFKYFFTCLNEEVARFANNIGTGPIYSNSITWINVNGYLHYNKVHIHPKSKVSGVFYVQTPEDCGKITFSHPASDILECCWQSRPETFSAFNAPSYSYAPIENRLILFPSFIRHEVKPNLNKKEKRISISFNFG